MNLVSQAQLLHHILILCYTFYITAQSHLQFSVVVFFNYHFHPFLDK